MPTQPEFPTLLQPPLYCQYTHGRCDQDFSKIQGSAAVFLYGSKPEIIASTIEEAVAKLRIRITPKRRFLTWRDFNVAGNVIYCEICKAMRGADTIFADITTLNFNLMFEIGFAMGLGRPVVLLRDSTYVVDAGEFARLGLFDTIGYLDFNNSEQLADLVVDKINVGTSTLPHDYPINQEQPLYYVKSSIPSEGQIKLTSTLDKSGIKYRTFDPLETPRISVYDAIQSVRQSHSIVSLLLSPQRSDASVVNARAAFISGVAMASQRVMLMLQEEHVPQPIDYRDIVQTFTQGSKVPGLVQPFIKATISRLQGSKFVPITLPLTALENLDFGDVAAENETSHLLQYFVATGEYSEVKRGRARLVVGRKGSGKSAIFYGLIEAFSRGNDYLVVDLKPEAHQLTEFKSLILKELDAGAKEHVLTAFWHYVLLVEMVYKILETEEHLASRDVELARDYQKLVELYDYDAAAEEGGFSERLYELIGRISAKVVGAGVSGLRSDQLTKLIYEKDIFAISNGLSTYLSRKESVWLLVDGLDKGWPVGGIETEDIMMMRCLLEATRKIQRTLERRDIATHAVVFLRNDVCDLLLREIPDKGKETSIYLDWNDAMLFKEVVHRRMAASTQSQLAFEKIWPMYFESHVNGEESFSYIASRTLQRPRDLIRFLKICVKVAVNRSHERVLESDVLHAEKEYSEDQLQDLSDELRGVYPELRDILYVFYGEPITFSESDLERILTNASVAESGREQVVQSLLWFGLFGIIDQRTKEKFAYEFRYGIKRMMLTAAHPRQYVIHPAFRLALESA